MFKASPERPAIPATTAPPHRPDLAAFSKLASAKWQAMSAAERRPYERQADVLNKEKEADLDDPKFRALDAVVRAA